jgi:hypothetical protein
MTQRARSLVTQIALKGTPPVFVVEWKKVDAAALFTEPVLKCELSRYVRTKRRG